MTGGWHHSPETVEALRNASRGRPKSPEERARIGEAQRARHARNRAAKAAERAEAAGDLADAMVWPALSLVGLVRDRDADGIAVFLSSLTRDQRRALPVVLAAMVDDERTPEQLLGWVGQEPAA